jgi:hypothetical protein
MANTISELNSTEGEPVCSFDGLASLGITHFHHLFKAQEGTYIAEIV